MMVVITEADKSRKEIHISFGKPEEVTEAKTSKIHQDVLGGVGMGGQFWQRTLMCKRSGAWSQHRSSS